MSNLFTHFTKKLNPMLLAGALVIPLDQTRDWQVLEYRGLKPNQVTFSPEGMAVLVASSASPVIYPLNEPVEVSGVSVSGSLSDLLNVKPDTQGQKNADDYALRIGLVAQGDKTLNFMQRMVSPSWVKTLFDLAPEGIGIDQTHFLSAVQFTELVSTEKSLHDSALFSNQNVWLIDKPGDFNLSYQLQQPVRILAIWISIDGDDSESRYSLNLKNLQLITTTQQ